MTPPACRSYVDGRIESVRAVGNLSRLREAVDASDSNGGAAVALQIAEATTGIGHTRWATHGKPSERNAHPHPDCTDRVHIVLNGIIENYVELRAQLEAEGHHFSSETDAEAVAHLIEKHIDVARSRQPDRGHAPRISRAARALRVRRRVRRRSRHDRRRAQGLPARDRRRRGRALRRIRDPRLPARDAPGAARQRRRDRDRAPRRRRVPQRQPASRSRARSRRSRGTRRRPRSPATRPSC